MHITFYKSRACPRCFIAGKHLQALCATNSHLQIEEIEILSSPLRAWGDGIRMIPALKIGDTVLSGVYLTKTAITKFVSQESDKRN